MFYNLSFIEGMMT